MTGPTYLDTEAVACRLGVERRTITAYLYEARQERAKVRQATIAGWPKARLTHTFPEPDETFSGRPVWKLSTIKRWERSRPGQGARTDLRSTARLH